MPRATPSSPARPSSSNFPITPGAFQTTSGKADAFVSKLNAAGSALLYSTYLGGRVDDGGFGIVVDASGNAYIVGFTFSSNFPTTPGAFQTTYAGNFDAFVAKIAFPNGPVFALNPSALTFLVLRMVGATSLPLTVNLTNVGGPELDVTGSGMVGTRRRGSG
jgi:hypothetical protein